MKIGSILYDAYRCYSFYDRICNAAFVKIPGDDDSLYCACI